MKLYIEPVYDQKKKVQDAASVYMPGRDVRDRMSQIRKDYAEAQYIRDRAYEEFNERSLVTVLNDDERAFNSYIPAPNEDVNQTWRANVVKPVTRAKAISIAANVTSAILYPNVIAQNKNSDMDRESAMVMKDLVEFSLSDSKYEQTFVNAVIAAMYSPIVFIEDAYAEVYRIVKEITEKGYTEREIIDSVFSGYQNLIVPCDSMYIGNPYEPQLQKQPFLIRQKFIDYTEAELKYGQLSDWKYVRPGVRVFYEDDQDTFYERYDEMLRNRLVEEVVYYNRLSDLEIVLVNGVMVHGDPERPIQRMDKMYPYVAFGFEPFNERFFYRKSLVNKIAPEQSIIDVLYGLAIDSAMLQTMPPAVTYGSEEIDSSVIVPGKVTPLREGSKFEAIGVGTNMNFALAMIQSMEGSIDQNSASSLLGGSTPKGVNTAFEVATIQENAMRVLGLFGKMIKFMVEEFGDLRIASIVQYMTVADGLETTGEISRLRFRDILIPDRMVDGKKMPRKISFVNNVYREEKEVEKRSYEILDKERTLEMSLAEVNPSLFTELQFKTKVEADLLFSQSETVKKALNLEAYDRAIANPIIQQDPTALKEVTRFFLLNNYVPGDEDKYLPQEQVSQEQALANSMGAAKPESSMMNKVLQRQPNQMNI